MTLHFYEKAERTSVLAEDIFAAPPVLKAHAKHGSVAWWRRRKVVHDEISDARPLKPSVGHL